MKSLLLLLILIPSICFAGISTSVPSKTDQQYVTVSATIIDLFSYYGTRTMKINGIPVASSFSNVYIKEIKLLPGRNFIHFVVEEQGKKYKKTKRIIYSKRYKNIDISETKHLQMSEFELLKSKYFDKKEKKLDYSIKGKPPIPIDLPLMKKDKNYDFFISVNGKF